MSNFALITCSKAEPPDTIEVNSASGKNVIARLIDFLRAKLTKTDLRTENTQKLVPIEAKSIELYENTSMFVINIPYEKEKLIKEIERITEFIHNFSRENEINCIVMSDELKDIEADWNSNASFDGHILYLSLLNVILDEICSNKGIKIGDLDITIIHGKSNELSAILSLLAPIVKYMTVLTDRKDDLEYEINQIYDETGLSVSLSSEPKAALKGCDIIINLGDAGCINSTKLNSKTLIINFDAAASKSIINENVIITGVEVVLPVKLLQKLDKEILKNFNTSSLAELVLCNKLGYFHANKENKYEILKSIADQFKKDGYRIASLKGRHNTIRLEQI